MKRLSLFVAALALAAVACGGASAVTGPVEITATGEGGFDAAWSDVFSLAAGREFELTLTEPAFEQAFIDGTAGSDTEFTAVDVVISDVGTITYDISFIEPNRGNELDAVVIFAVSLTTDGDFIITAEEAEIRSAALSLDVPPFLLATFNDNLVDSLDGQRFAAGQGREAVFTDIAFETGQVILTGRIESTE